MVFEKFTYILSSWLSLPTYHPIIQELLSHFVVEHYEADDIVISQGVIADSFYFINNGYLRLYRTDEKTFLETTTHIYCENELATSFISLQNNEPSQFTLEAITPAQLFMIKKENLYLMYKKYPQLEKAGRQMVEKIYKRYFEIGVAHITMNAKEKYLWLQENRPCICNVPIKYIANLLGIHPNSLSRLRKELKEEKKIKPKYSKQKL